MWAATHRKDVASTLRRYRVMAMAFDPAQDCAVHACHQIPDNAM